ncbi:MAG: tetratricopeptide repeat protein [Chitinivibrionales bacterium]|nr:tetratricopeptide repeat protein [Chitinivibrionales bacterium]
MSERMAYFDDELRRDVSDEHIDYDAMWEKLEARMNTADELGELAVLKQHEELTDGAWERIAQRLNQRIAEHDEYDEPVDECIRAEQDLPNEQTQRSWERLSQAMDSVAEAPAWEQHLKADVVPSQGQWERIERGLMDRIKDYEVGVVLSDKIIVFPLHRMMKAAAVLVLAVLGGVGGYLAYRAHLATVPTYVWQAHGANVDLVTTAEPLQEQFSTQEGGTAEIVNQHGSVLLQNGASLHMARRTREEARYDLDLRHDEAAGAVRGKATFFVKNASARKAFVVATGEYDIRVTGTYFRVSQDIGERIATEVLEGTVEMRVEPLGTIELQAGQSLVYSHDLERYVVRSGGPVIDRREIAAMPDLSDIDRYRPLTVTASVAFADVTVDGIYRGATPLCLLLSPGPHRVRISREGHAAVDTVVQTGRTARLYAALPSVAGELVRPEAPAPRLQPRVDTPVRVDTAVAPVDTQSAVTAAPRDEAPLLAARRLERTDPSAALAAYQALLGRDDLPPLVRETALFSVGRLQAEHAGDHDAARESFLAYLALYPSGTFARESLLRLAEIEFKHDQDKAIAYYQRYFEKYPNHYRVAELQYRVGLIYLQEKRHDEAIYMFRQSLSNMLGDSPQMRRRVYTSLHKAMTEKGDYANARIVEDQYLNPQ